MSNVKKQKGYSNKNLPPGQKDAPTTEQRLKQGDPVTMVPQNSGLYHTIVPMKNLTFKVAQNEAIIQQGGSFIVLGTDRPSGVASGAGGTGYQNASMIDLVVGRMSSAHGFQEKPDSDAPQSIPKYVDNSYSADAARIVISQLANLDKDFGIEQGVSGVSTPGAGIGIKADDVRLIGRRSIKIMTGKTQGSKGDGQSGEPTSMGGWMHQPAPTIELIAGNSDGDQWKWPGIGGDGRNGIVSGIQGAAMGENVVDAIGELVKYVGYLQSAAYNQSLINTALNSVIGIDPAGTRPHIVAAVPPTGVGTFSYVSDLLFETQIGLIFFNFNYLWPMSYKYLASSNVKIS